MLGKFGVIQGDKKGDIVQVGKSCNYKKGEAGTLRIVLHHSSLPYAPDLVAASYPFTNC